MKLGVINVLFGGETLEWALSYFKSLGIEEIEVGCGGYPGKAHCDPAVLLADDKKLEEFKNLFDKYGLKINALGCHGNPVHPDKATAEKYINDWHNAVLLAEKLGVKKIIGFGACGPRLVKDLDFENSEVVTTLDEAMQIAKREAVSGDTVLLSPTTSSFDQYSCFEERGEHFKKIVMEF